MQAELSQLKLKVDAALEPAVAATAVQHLLARRHNGQNDTRMVIPARLLAQQQQTQRIFTIVMSAVAGISLLVGGIGIMNIMLVSVTERTREIGLRLAVGAKRRDVRNQFLIESVVLCLIGGLAGLVAGVSGTLIYAEVGQLEIAIDPVIVAIAIGASAMVGVFFGLYPAHRASRLDPIEALRFE